MKIFSFKILSFIFSYLIISFGYSQSNQTVDLNTLQQNFLSQQKVNQKASQDRLKADSIQQANFQKLKNDSLLNSLGYVPVTAQSIESLARFQSVNAQLSSVNGAENIGFENGFSGWIGTISYNLSSFECVNPGDQDNDGDIDNTDYNLCRAKRILQTRNVFDETGIVSYPPASKWDIEPYILTTPLRDQPPRHKLITDKNLVDPYGGFHVFDQNIPELGNSVARIGNGTIGVFAEVGSLNPSTRSTFLYEQESLSYTFLVGSNDKYLYINYAVVLNETNSLHTGTDRTYFSMSLKDENNEVFECSKVDVFVNSQSNIPGFILSPVTSWNEGNGDNGRVFYKPWSATLIDLTPFVGTTVTLNFATGDCLSGGHWAYAYVNAFTSSVGIKTTASSGSDSEVFCQGNEINFFSDFTGRYDGESYLWDFGDGTGSTLKSPTHAYTVQGEYTVTLSVTSPLINGCAPISKQIIITPSPTASVDFTVQSYLCATNFVPLINYGNVDCRAISYLWDFGDGNTSIDKNPIHVYNNSGTFNVSLTIEYQCGDCTNEVTISKQITFNPTQATVENLDIAVSTPVKNKVISASAVTFSDVWPLAHDNAALGTKSSYLNGTQGVWRNNASYAYDVPRKQSTPTNIATDGTFTLNQFDWNTANFNVVPDWIQANSMTEYSPYSFELENRDVLGVYSSALYDYGGQLPTANGVNMRHAEMGFTSFEFVDPQGKPSGNWMLSVMQLPATITFQVEKATGYIAEVNSSLEELDLVTKVDVAASAAYFDPPVLFSERLFNYLQEVDILCKQAHPADPNKTIVVLSRAPFEGLWSGRLSIKRTTPPTTKPTLDNAVAHSGKKSLKVTTTPQTFRQEMFQLQAGKTYWVNAWVSVGNPNLLEPKLPNNLGIQLTFLDKIDQPQGSVSFQPVGTIIEGWQQVKGTFICPIDKPTIQLTFRPGDGGIAYYDDLRLQPEKGNMKAYVYNVLDYRLQAILDEENYASFFYYDAEGNLYLTKKETERGIKTITENVSYQIEVIR
jgi:PKD repeat protein